MKHDSIQHKHRMVDTHKAAEYCGLSMYTLRNMRYRGNGPPYAKLGSAVRYRVSDLYQWLENKTCSSTEEAKTK